MKTFCQYIATVLLLLSYCYCPNATVLLLLSYFYYPIATVLLLLSYCHCPIAFQLLYQKIFVFVVHKYST
jgi:hypothetical protein